MTSYINIPDCEWYEIDTIPEIEDFKEFSVNVLKPLRETIDGKYRRKYYNTGELGSYIKEHDISKPMFEKTVIEVGIAENWSQAQGYWNQIWIESL